MKLAIESPPRTLIEVFRILPEGTLAELIDNTLYMSPSPISSHQRVLNKINNSIYNFFEKTKQGEVFIAPFDVYLDEESNAVQPDIVVVLNQNNHIINPNGHIHGVPDLLVEVLSPSNKEFDLVKKKELYERFGVKEYWIVDPETKLASVFQRVGNSFTKPSESIGSIQSPLLGQSFTF
jgi:Uma2 family endonuclease